MLGVVTVVVGARLQLQSQVLGVVKIVGVPEGGAVGVLGVVGVVLGSGPPPIPPTRGAGLALAATG